MSGNYLFSGRTSATTPAGTETVPILQGGAIKLETVNGLRVPTYLGVGDIVFALYDVDAAVASGDVIAGAHLFADSPEISYLALLGATPSTPVFPVVVGTALTGTWRALQYLPSSSTYFNNAVGGYFRRVS